MTKLGETITRHKASTWTVGEAKLALAGSPIKISDELAELLEEEGEDDEDL